MTSDMNFQLFNPTKPEPETPPSLDWDQALKISNEVQKPVVLGDPPSSLEAPEPRRMVVTLGETQETQPEPTPQIDPLSSSAIEAELQRKMVAANEEITQATEPEPEVTPPKEDTIGWFTVIVSLFFGLSVFMFKHAATLVITFLTYVDPDIKQKWTSNSTSVEA